MRLKDFKKKYYYLKNIYCLNSYLEGDEFIHVNCDDHIYKLLDHSLFLKDDNGLKVNYQLTDDEFDKYRLEINFKNEINIQAANERTLRYVSFLLNDLVDFDTVAILPFILIEDQASFKYRGIIEGYYGTPWSFENRLKMIDFMDKYRLNTYMYAPKTDRYHRDKWYEPYPEELLEQFKVLVSSMKERGIDFYYCISPGHAPKGEKGFVYVGDEDFNRLFRKLDQMIDIGITSFGLLLDDIDYNLKGENLEIFKRPGVAHSHICNRVYDYLKSRIPNVNFVMCPTEYHEIGDSPYRTDLRNLLNKDIFVYWTGDNVCAEMINDEQTLLTKEAFGHEILIWENFPVSDFKYGVREYIGALDNRTVNLSKHCQGFLINPSVCYEISRVSMITEAHYAWNSEKYVPDYSLDIALRDFGDDFYEAWIDYIEYNYPSVLSYGNQHYEKRLVDNCKYDELMKYLNKVYKSCNKTLKYDYPIVKELTPWLIRTKKEIKLIGKIIANEYTKEEVIKFLEDIHFSGSEILDMLIMKNNILNEEEYEKLITKRRGYPWYRVWEHKR